MKYTRDWDLDSIPYDILQSAAARRRRARQKPPTPKKVSLCPLGCGKSFGVVEMRKHKTVCRRKQAKPVQPQQGQKPKTTKESLILSVEDACRSVLRELGLNGGPVLDTLPKVCRDEIFAGKDPVALCEKLIAAYREYNDPDRPLRKGAASFFGDGDWKNRSAWPKAGREEGTHRFAR